MLVILQIAYDVVLEARRNSFFWLSIFLAILLISLFALLSGTNPDFHYDQFLRNGLSMVWLIHLVLALLITTETIYGEDERMSIYFYLSRNVNRFNYLVGKFLGCWGTLLISLLLSFIVMFIAGGTLVGLIEQIAWSFIFISLELSLSVAIIILLSRVFSKLITYFLFLVTLIISNFIEFIILKGTSTIGFIMTGVPSYKYYSYLELIVDNQYTQIWLYTIVLCLFTMFISGAILSLANLKFKRQFL